MSGKFGGFSQDDINKIKTNTKNKENSKSLHISQYATHPTSTYLPVKTVKPPVVKKLMPQPKTNPTESKKSQSAQSPALGALSSNEQDTSSILTTDNSLQDAIHFKPLPHKVYGPTVDVESLHGINTADEIDDSAIQETTTPFKGISLKDYEAQRRMVEEQNKHKKDLLYKAIEQQ